MSPRPSGGPKLSLLMLMVAKADGEVTFIERTLDMPGGGGTLTGPKLRLSCPDCIPAGNERSPKASNEGCDSRRGGKEVSGPAGGAELTEDMPRRKDNEDAILPLGFGTYGAEQGLEMVCGRTEAGGADVGEVVRGGLTAGDSSPQDVEERRLLIRLALSLQDSPGAEESMLVLIPPREMVGDGT